MPHIFPSDKGGGIDHLLNGSIYLFFDLKVLTKQVYHFYLVHLYRLTGTIYEDSKNCGLITWF